MKILWAEDRTDQIKGHLTVLRAKDHTVAVLPTAEQVLDAVQEASDSGGPFELIILDIMLPKGVGNRVDDTVRPAVMGEEVLRKLGSMATVPVICVTAIADEPLRSRLQKAECVKGVLKKPIRIQELLEKIDETAEGNPCTGG